MKYFWFAALIFNIATIAGMLVFAKTIGVHPALMLAGVFAGWALHIAFIETLAHWSNA
jgi:hypothetical protein